MCLSSPTTGGELGSETQADFKAGRLGEKPRAAGELGVTDLCVSSPSPCRPHSTAGPRQPHSPSLASGQASPNECPRCRDPEVSFELLARPLEGGLLPGCGLSESVVAVETASMAAPRQTSSRIAHREEAGGSADLSATTRTPVPAVPPGSPESLVSPVQVAEPPGKNLWEQICEGRLTGLGGTRGDAHSEPLCARRVTRAASRASGPRAGGSLDPGATSGDRHAGKRRQGVAWCGVSGRDRHRPPIFGWKAGNEWALLTGSSNFSVRSQWPTREVLWCGQMGFEFFLPQNLSELPQTQASSLVSSQPMYLGHGVL